MLGSVKQAIIDRLGISRVARSGDETRALLEQTRAQVSSLLDASSASAAGLTHLQEQLRLWQIISWGSTLAAAQPAPGQCAQISVVLPTRNRSRSVREAVASVFAQTSRDWELVVVDDGSDDDTPTVLAAIDDRRVRVVRTPGLGAGGARNAGLAAATGDYVAFLDDDNRMAAGWIHAVQLHIAANPECRALYGAQLRQAEPGEEEVGPSLLFVPSPQLDALIELNCIDLGALVVRRDHPELRFDEQLRRGIDWEMVVRLFRSGAMDSVAAWASWYLTGANTRITTEVDRSALDDLVRRMRDPDDPLGVPGRFHSDEGVHGE